MPFETPLSLVLQSATAALKIRVCSREFLLEWLEAQREPRGNQVVPWKRPAQNGP